MGRKKKKQYVKLDYDFIYSRTRCSLSLAAREVYTQLKAARNIKDGRGKIINRTDDFIQFGSGDCDGMSRPTFKKAIMQLEEKGLIATVDPGEFPGRKGAYALVDEWMERELSKNVQWD